MASKFDSGVHKKTFNNAAAKPVVKKPVDDGIPKKKIIAPSPTGMQGPKPPPGAAAAAARYVFAKQLASSKPPAASTVPAKPLTPKKDFSKAAQPTTSQSFNAAAKSNSNSAGKGRSR